MESRTRTFESGAVRDTDSDKYDYDAFLDPRVLVEYARYMHRHRQMPDGTVRSGDNWKAGFPLDSYIKSLLRHVIDLWLLHSGYESRRPETDELVSMDDALGGVLFNVMGYWSALQVPSVPAVEHWPIGYPKPRTEDV